MAEATLKFIRLTPRKAMLIADLIRGRAVTEALNILRFSKRKRAAEYMSGVIRSAVANLEQKSSQSTDWDNLVVKRVEIGKGPTLKRFRPRAMGRAHNLNKKTCHISVSVVEK